MRHMRMMLDSTNSRSADAGSTWESSRLGAAARVNGWRRIGHKMKVLKPGVAWVACPDNENQVPTLLWVEKD